MSLCLGILRRLSKSDDINEVLMPYENTNYEISPGKSRQIESGDLPGDFFR